MRLQQQSFLKNKELLLDFRKSIYTYIPDIRLLGTIYCYTPAMFDIPIILSDSRLIYVIIGAFAIDVKHKKLGRLFRKPIAANTVSIPKNVLGSVASQYGLNILTWPEWLINLAFAKELDLKSRSIANYIDLAEHHGTAIEFMSLKNFLSKQSNYMLLKEIPLPKKRKEDRLLKEMLNIW